MPKDYNTIAAINDELKERLGELDPESEEFRCIRRQIYSDKELKLFEKALYCYKRGLFEQSLGYVYYIIRNSPFNADAWEIKAEAEKRISSPSAIDSYKHAIKSRRFRNEDIKKSARGFGEDTSNSFGSYLGQLWGKFISSSKR